MRKIRLQLDALAVESFQTADAETGAGTVHGHQEVSQWEKCLATGGGSCPRRMSEDWSCVYWCECTDAYYACDAS